VPVMSQYDQDASVNNLIQLWSVRYTLNFLADLSKIMNQGEVTLAQLLEVSSADRRLAIANRIQHNLMTKCEWAGIQTDALYSNYSNVINLSESKRIADAAVKVYYEVLNIYKQRVFPFSLPTHLSSKLEKDFPISFFLDNSDTALVDLVVQLEPVLNELRMQHLLASDRRAIGFVTTQFHFSTQLILSRTIPAEQVLLRPYLQFVEEQVYIPWQRFCRAAANQPLESEAMSIVRCLLPVTWEIAQETYQITLRRYPNFQSRRGKLASLPIAASTIRDMQMFQIYLHLCLLEGSMAAVEQKLLPLSQMVFPSVQVKWGFVQQILKILLETMFLRLEPSQQTFFQPYMDAMIGLFANVLD